MPRCNFNHSFISTLLMREEPVTSNRDSLWYKWIYQNPDLPVQCIKLKTIFLICALVADHRETRRFFIPVLQRPGPRHAKQAGHLRPLASIRTMGGGPGGTPQACWVRVSSLLRSLLCWKAFLIPWIQWACQAAQAILFQQQLCNAARAVLLGLLVRASHVTSAWVNEAGLG